MMMYVLICYVSLAIHMLFFWEGRENQTAIRQLSIILWPKNLSFNMNIMMMLLEVKFSVYSLDFNGNQAIEMKAHSIIIAVLKHALPPPHSILTPLSFHALVVRLHSEMMPSCINFQLYLPRFYCGWKGGKRN